MLTRGLCDVQKLAVSRGWQSASAQSPLASRGEF